MSGAAALDVRVRDKRTDFDGSSPVRLFVQGPA
jgi:hypothetical protein